jgi:hypothetical protein
MTSKLKRPRDPNQLAKLIVDIATGEREDCAPACNFGSDSLSVQLR